MPVESFNDELDAIDEEMELSKLIDPAYQDEQSLCHLDEKPGEDEDRDMTEGHNIIDNAASVGQKRSRTEKEARPKKRPRSTKVSFPSKPMKGADSSQDSQAMERLKIFNATNPVPTPRVLHLHHGRRTVRENCHQLPTRFHHFAQVLTWK